MNPALLAVAVALVVYLLTRQGSATPKPDPDKVTLSPAQLEAIAVGVYVAIWGPGGWLPWEDEHAVVEFLKMAQTQDDVYAIIEAYGERAPEPHVGDATLPSVVKQFLSAEDIGAINSNYAGKGITYRFGV